LIVEKTILIIICISPLNLFLEPTCT